MFIEIKDIVSSFGVTLTIFIFVSCVVLGVYAFQLWYNLIGFPLVVGGICFIVLWLFILLLKTRGKDG